MSDGAAILLMLEDIQRNVREIGRKVDTNTKAIAGLEASGGWQKLAKQYLPWILAAAGVGVGGGVAAQGQVNDQGRRAESAPESRGTVKDSPSGVPTVHGPHKHPGE